MKAVKRLLFASRSSSIRPRNSESGVGPWSSTQSTTSATGISTAASVASRPLSISRSAIGSRRSPPQVLRSDVVGVAV